MQDIKLLTEEDFTSFNFTKTEENTYERANVMNPAHEAFLDATQRSKSKIIIKSYPNDFDADYGSSLEIYLGDKPIISGYWTDKEDFKKSLENQFKL